MLRSPRLTLTALAGLLAAACGGDDGAAGSRRGSGGVDAGAAAGGTVATGGSGFTPATGGAPFPTAGAGGTAAGGAGGSSGGGGGSGGTSTGGLGGLGGLGGSSTSPDAGDAGPNAAEDGGTTDASATDAGGPEQASDSGGTSADATISVPDGSGGRDGGNASAGDSGTNGGTGGSGGSGGAADAGYACLGVTGPSTFPEVTDFSTAGPFAVETVGEGPACTMFRPQGLDSSTRLHPVILWGNGTAGSPPVYAAALEHWASHGFIVAAANTAFAGSGNEMLACLDYLLDQNTTAGSVYEGRIDTAHIGASGHSQGGGGAVMAGADPRVTITAPLQPWFGLSDITKQSQQNGPMFIMSGSADTIAVPEIEQEPLFNNSNVATFWGILEGADHLGSALGDMSGYRGPATAWFRLLLMNDINAAPLFCDPECTLCADPTWDVQRKDFY